MNNRYNLLLLLFLFSVSAYAQEVVIPLYENPVIKRFHATRQPEKIKYKTTTPDTLTLPFTDDFSKEGVFPDYTMWTDSFAFINRDYPVNPPTLGVATLDGVSANGSPYNPVNPTAYGIADRLTSRPINLGLPLSSADSVYLSFYYQPQGIGNDPEDKDSLVLEFRDPTTTLWNWVWSTSGIAMQPFLQVMVPITDTLYLKNGFQFRFKNYATISGNVDHWHIDYVKLDKMRNIGDTILEDVAFVERTHSMIKPFREMPWTHYLTNPAAYTRDSMIINIRNNDKGSPPPLAKNVNYKYYVKDISGNVLFSFPTGTAAYNINPDTLYTIRSPFSYTFSGSGDSAVFYSENVLYTVPDDNAWNDTVRECQHFYNYYAYDDGTAEAAYGLNAYGAKLAYRFDLAKTDTLRALAMYFNRMQTNVSQKTFRLAIWNSLSPENLLYKSDLVNPMYDDSLNGFFTYRLDTTLIVSGTIYVGWIQTEPETLSIGLDMNTDASAYMYYNVSGTWNNSIVKGAWMIRPLLGDTVLPPLHVPVYANRNDQEFTVFPNPATDKVSFFPVPTGAKSLRIFDITGREVLSQKFIENEINTSSLAPGVYLLYLHNEAGLEIFRKKILIAR